MNHTPQYRRITRTSKLTGITRTLELELTAEQAEEVSRAPEMRRNVQEIVPHLSPEEREFLITGITPDEWDDIFTDTLTDNAGGIE